MVSKTDLEHDMALTTVEKWFQRRLDGFIRTFDTATAPATATSISAATATAYTPAVVAALAAAPATVPATQHPNDNQHYDQHHDGRQTMFVYIPSVFLS